jgi:methylated-DNA-[protein]-cysteine S-methyltransferase
MNASPMYTTIESPIGEIVLTSCGELITGLYTSEHRYYQHAKQGTFNAIPFQAAIAQLHEYFQGKRNTFDLALAPTGTVFQQSVWHALSSIPYGATTSYGALAKSLNAPSASRAVGLANGKNPISIIIPCHRVIGSHGQLTGYAGGVKIKEWLLQHEAKVFGISRPLSQPTIC